jgi:acetyl-CoA C-acetyltransferase
MNTYIVSAVRTPIGSFQGALGTLPAPRLGAIAIKNAIQNAGVNGDDVGEVIMGQVLTAGAGQAPARQAAIYAGLPVSVPCMTINKVCGSGLKAIMLASDSIQLGHTQLAVAGGQESMTLAPHLLENSRAGFRMGNAQLTDSMLKDGLWDPYSDFHMGNAGEICAREYKFTREEQDQYAKESYELAAAAQSKGYFKNEIVTVEIPVKDKTISVTTDEEPAKVKYDKIPTLRPAFTKDGTITAANASKLNDGASAVVLASESYVKNHKLKPLARVVAHSTFSQDPKWFTTAPVAAIKAVVEKAQLSIDQIDLFEINEAFSLVAMAAIRDCKIPRNKVNVHGGAVALGHPIGASGARIMTTLVHALKTHNKKYGLATLCIGGGEAVAVIVENISSENL